MFTVKLLQNPEPHHLPGYTGYCPQHKYSPGETFGKLSNKLLQNPEVKHAEKSVLSDFKAQGTKPTKDDIEIVNSRRNRTDSVYNYPVVSSYTGFIPHMGELGDRPREVDAIEAIAKFEREELKRKASEKQFKQIFNMQNGRYDPDSLKDDLVLKSKYKLPLRVIRPEYADIYKEPLPKEKYVRPKNYHPSPYFASRGDPEKYLKTGYTGYSPYKNVHFGKTYKQMSADGLIDFTSSYLWKQANEWEPLTVPKPPEAEPVTDGTIYQKNTPLMSSYTGHIPGAIFRIGKTHGYCSKNARDYLDNTYGHLKLGECRKY